VVKVVIELFTYYNSCNYSAGANLAIEVSAKNISTPLFKQVSTTERNIQNAF
jgi:hypothetical protein